MNCKRCKKGVFLIVQLRRYYNHRHLPPYYYILPWQMKSIFIIVCFSLFCPEMPCFVRDFRDSCSLLWNYRLWWISAEWSILLLPVSSKIGSKREMLTTKDFHLFLCHHLLYLYLPFLLAFCLYQANLQIVDFVQITLLLHSSLEYKLFYLFGINYPFGTT